MHGFHSLNLCRSRCFWPSANIDYHRGSGMCRSYLILFINTPFIFSNYSTVVGWKWSKTLKINLIKLASYPLNSEGFLLFAKQVLFLRFLSNNCFHYLFIFIYQWCLFLLLGTRANGTFLPGKILPKTFSAVLSWTYTKGSCQKFLQLSISHDIHEQNTNLWGFVEAVIFWISKTLWGISVQFHLNIYESVSFILYHKIFSLRAGLWSPAGAEQCGSDLCGIDQPTNGTKPSHSSSPAFSVHILKCPKTSLWEWIWTLSPTLFFSEKIFLLPVFQNFVDYCAAGDKLKILIMSFILVCWKRTSCLPPPSQILLKKAKEGSGKNIRDVLIWINPLLSTITASH